MSKKVELNVKAMLENGAIAVGALADGKNHVMAILCDKAHYIIPVISKKAYVGTTDDAEILDEIIKQINEAAVYHEQIVQNLFFSEEFKKCSACGRTLLKSPRNFVRKSRSKDGYANKCKCCDKKDRQNKKNQEEKKNA